jgi:hypothetical protein
MNKSSATTYGPPSVHLPWLDWMKVLALFFVAWGHFFSEGYLYLYVFNVQVFCVVSGYLYHQAPDWRTCLVKNVRQLLVPTVILSIVMQLEAVVRCWWLGTIYEISWPWFFKNLLIGHRWCMGPCWFFYTLFVIRLFMQLLPRRWWLSVVLIIASAAGAITLHNKGIEVSNAWTNVLVCLPPFLIGQLLQPLKQRLAPFHHTLLQVALFVLSVALVWLCGRYNGEVWMYLCGYGNSFPLFLLGTVAGTSMLYVLSRWLSRLPVNTVIETISRGSILVVGVHIIVVRRLMELPNRFWLEDFIISLLILLAFYPIILVVQYYCPWIMGLRKKTKHSRNNKS